MSDITGVNDLMCHYRSTVDRHQYPESVIRCDVVQRIQAMRASFRRPSGVIFLL